MTNRLGRRGSVTGTARGGAPQHAYGPAGMDLQDDVGATMTAEQEIRVDVDVPVTVNRDAICPPWHPLCRGQRCLADALLRSF
jgi:hypothetical protein